MLSNVLGNPDERNPKMLASGSAALDAAGCEVAIIDSHALERAFDRCSSALYRYIAVRVGDTHLADDMMQQLWVQTTTGARHVPLDQLEYWMRVVARNLIRSHWRQQKRRPTHVPVHDERLAAHLGEQLASEEIPAAELERQEIRDQLLLAITDLASEEQELIVAFYFDGQSQVAIAAKLGISERAVEGRLYRARQALREALRSAGEE